MTSAQERQKIIPGAAPFPRNQWYVAAFSSEVTREPIHRLLCDEPVVMYRTEAGKPVALFDRCPHRGMRLSNGGKVIGDNIQCNYHGLQFGSDGLCKLIPSGGVPTSALAVQCFPVVEISGWIWFWPGDPDAADESLLPDHDQIGLTADGFFSYFGVCLPANSNYLYSIENLVDATHITYLHHGLIDNGQVASHPYDVEVAGVMVTMTRVFERETQPPMLRAAFQLRGEHVDRILELTSYAPNLCIVRNAFRDLDFPDAPMRDNRLVFGVTPATTKSCYQFVGVAQNYESHHPALFDDLRTLLMEDVIALNDVQILFDSLPDSKRREVSVRSDEGAIRTRRIIATQIADEHPHVLQAVD